MKKLNNKGMTMIEVLVTFVIVVIIVVAMYASISNLRNRQTIASYKESIITYKDLLTREIQNDLILKQLISVEKTGDREVKFKFKDNSVKTLSIKQVNTLKVANNDEVSVCNNPKTKSSESITYDGVEYPIPDLGSDNVSINGGACATVYSLKISNVEIDTGDTDNIFKLRVEFNHPDLGNRYSINIISPIDYQ